MIKTPRFRSKGSLNNELNGTYTRTNRGTPDPTVNFVYGTESDYESMSDYVIKDFGRRSNRGEVWVNPMLQTVENRTTESGPFTREYYKYLSGAWELQTVYDFSNAKWLTNGGNYPHLGPLSHLSTSIDVQQLRTLAGTQAQANIQEPEFQGLVFVAELRETLRFLRSPLRSYQRWLKRREKSFRRARKRNPEKFRGYTLADYISSGWLGYRYGLMPIIYDVQDAVSAITSLEDITNRATARGYASNEQTASTTLSESPFWCNNMSKDINTRRVVSARAGVLYETDCRDTFGVSMQQVPSALWEIVPFSFVADWFVNINDYIGAITPKAGVNVLGSWTVVDDYSVSSATGVADGSEHVDGDRKYIVTVPSSSYEFLESRTKQRTKGVSIGITSRPIPYSGDIGKKRILDTLALTFQLLKGKA